MSLFAGRRFAPLFWVQFLGAFNDNLLKNALLVMATYGSLPLHGWQAEQVVPISAGLFILPFALFSILAGQLADKFRKSSVVRAVKRAEVLIMGIAAIGFLTAQLEVIWLSLFFMGCHSACFGPVKYGMLPELLEPAELMRGNGWIEAGTFIAIVGGTLAGGMLSGVGVHSTWWVAGGGLALAMVGAVIAQAVPPTDANHPDLPIRLGFGEPVRAALQAMRRDKLLAVSVCGISWFWFLGAAVLTLLPLYGRQAMHADEQVVSVLLALFCVGIGIGSALCGALAKGGGGKRWSTIGGVGIALFFFDLAWASRGFGHGHAAGELIGLRTVLHDPAVCRAIFDLCMLSMCGGLFSVPLFTLVQERAPSSMRARIIAANNLLSALLMTVASVLLFWLLHIRTSFAALFLLFALLHSLVMLIAWSLRHRLRA